MSKSSGDSIYRVRFLNIHSKLPRTFGVVVSPPIGASQTQQNNTQNDLFIDIVNETGQITRRIFLGRLKCPQVKRLGRASHISKSPVSLHMVEGYYNRVLGKHTISVLHEANDFLQTKVLTYGLRDTPVYQLEYCIEKVYYKYNFMLNSITCLKQSKWIPERVFAEVEFNYSVNNVNAQPTNRYWLGHFQSHESSEAFSSHHFAFSAVSSFCVKFHVQNYLWPNTCIDEWIFEVFTNDKRPELEYISFLRSAPQGKKTEHIKFNKNNSVVKTITVEKNGLAYMMQFTIEREALPVVENQDNQEQEDEEYTKKFLSQSNENNQKSNSIVKPFSVTSRNFSTLLSNNEIEILIDGLQTFQRYYHYMMQAQYSINILAWELSLSFGLVYLSNPTQKQLLERLQSKFSQGNWVTLQDVLLAKARAGVKIRIMVWRHRFLSYLNRLLYLGEVTIEREVAKLQKKASQMGIKVKIYHTAFNLPDIKSPYADPFGKMPDADIVIVIVKGPKGVISCHHEKVVLIDAEKPNRCVGFVGGFDIARGRFDQPLHLPPRSFFDFSSLLSEEPLPRYSGRAIQPLFQPLLWHDIQVFIRGPATRPVYLHFVQRWAHAFTRDNHMVRQLQLPNFSDGEPMKDLIDAKIYKCTLRMLRAWPGVFDSHVLLDNFCALIRNAKDYIYIEHQYPFHNFALTHCLCEALQRNKNLRVIIVTPVKTDLPTGIVGKLLDMSQDDINEQLLLIYTTASDRVGIYGLIRQDTKSKVIKSIYVHSKLLIVDDKIVCVGSSNMDNLSFNLSSELNMNIYNAQVATHTKERLVREHLEYFTPDMRKDFKLIFNAFKEAATSNHESLSKSGIATARLVYLVPTSRYLFISKLVNYPNPIAKAMYKLGWNPRNAMTTVIQNLSESSPGVHSFYLQSML